LRETIKFLGRKQEFNHVTYVSTTILSTTEVLTATRPAEK
jgi:hypothetical protein